MKKSTGLSHVNKCNALTSSYALGESRASQIPFHDWPLTEPYPSVPSPYTAFTLWRGRKIVQPSTHRQ